MRVVLGSTWFRSIAARATCPAFAASGFWGKLSAMSAVKEKIFPGNIAAWLAVLFILLATMAIGTPTASAIPTHRDYTSQNRVGENSVAAVQLRLAQSPQTPELQRESSIGRYDLALDDTLAAESAANPIEGLPRVGSALKTDPYHAFPDVIDNFASSATKTPLSSGGNLYQAEGSLNDVAGRFEWIVDNGNVTHRLFVPGGTLNGVPIKP